MDDDYFDNAAEITIFRPTSAPDDAIARAGKSDADSAESAQIDQLAERSTRVQHAAGRAATANQAAQDARKKVEAAHEFLTAADVALRQAEADNIHAQIRARRANEAYDQALRRARERARAHLRRRAA